MAERTYNIILKPKMTDEQEAQEDLPKLIITFRGKKCGDDFVWNKRTTIISDVKSYLAVLTPPPSCIDRGEAGEAETIVGMQLSDVKLIYKGKILSDDSANLYNSLIGDHFKKTQTQTHHSHSSINNNNSKKPIRLMAMAMSKQEAKRNDDEFHEAKINAPRIRDDLTSNGKADIAARQRQGRNMLQQASKKDFSSRYHSNVNYGFNHIQILPMLPDQEKAKEILYSLSTDPGILACMTKHKWNVGSLCELYPEGNVGESEVCVMGLNQNKGQKILLRLRTDDLKGFRKILNIRKVLFHELAHNVHSNHDNEFYKLMRQIEKECNDLDWTKGGHYSSSTPSSSQTTDGSSSSSLFSGGTYVLGSDNSSSDGQQQSNHQLLLSARELAARAAMKRLSDEEKEIQEACGCYQQHQHTIISESKTTTTTTSAIMEDNDDSMSYCSTS
jgi:hypothetical protein